MTNTNENIEQLKAEAAEITAAMERLADKTWELVKSGDIHIDSLYGVHAGRASLSVDPWIYEGGVDYEGVDYDWETDGWSFSADAANPLDWYTSGDGPSC